VTIVSLWQGDNWVAECSVVDDIVSVRADVDEQGQVNPDLGGGQPDTVGGVHRGEHVADEGRQVLIELCDWTGLRMQDGFSPSCHPTQRPTFEQILPAGVVIGGVLAHG